LLTLNRILRFLVFTLAVLALIASVGLLANDFTSAGVHGRLADALSAFPLLAVGLAFVLAQQSVRPRPWELLKNLLLAATFVLWGVVQLMGQSHLAKILADGVIALYVTDLAWTIFAQPQK
jgi:hypothetical protein